MRDGVKAPTQRAGGDVVGANVAGGAGERLGNTAPHNEQVLEDDARRAGTDRQSLHGAIEAGAQIHPSVGTKGRDGFTGGAIQRIQPIAIIEQHAVARDHDAAMPDARRGRCAVVGIEAPELLARHGVERKHLQLGRGGVEHPINHDGIGLHLGAVELVVRLVAPRHFERGDVLGRDLSQCGEVRVLVIATIDGPIDGLALCGEDGRPDDGEAQREQRRGQYHTGGATGGATAPRVEDHARQGAQRAPA